MDHHCVALNNCIGLYNYKYFLCAWFYMLLAAVNGLLLAIVRYVCAAPSPSDSPGQSLHFVLYALLCALVTNMAWSHFQRNANLAALNLTAIEYLRLPAYISLRFVDRYKAKGWTRVSNWDKGWRHNLIQVLGEPVCTWLMPWLAPRSPWGPFPVTCTNECSLTRAIHWRKRVGCTHCTHA